jgi:hypothetical protein
MMHLGNSSFLVNVFSYCSKMRWLYQSIRWCIRVYPSAIVPKLCGNYALFSANHATNYPSDSHQWKLFPVQIKDKWCVTEKYSLHDMSIATYLILPHGWT